jgi:hypothetical protein
MRATLLTSAVCHAQWFNRMTHLSTYLGASITSWMMYLFNCSKRKYRLPLSSIRLYRCYIPYQTALRSAMFVTHDPAPTLNLACNSNTHQSDPLPCDVVSIIPCCVVVSLSGSSNDLLVAGCKIGLSRSGSSDHKTSARPCHLGTQRISSKLTNKSYITISRSQITCFREIQLVFSLLSLPRVSCSEFRQ